MKSPHKSVFFGERTFIIYEEVYEPAEDTFLIAENLSVTCGEKILDMGTGCGILAVIAAEKASKVVAVDVNPHAVNCAKKNADLNGVRAKVEVRQGNLFSSVRDTERFDLILFNAPYLPVERDEGRSWIERAWSGGETGRIVIDQFINVTPSYLTEKGRILLVQSTLSDVDKTMAGFSGKGLDAEIIAEKKSLFESIILVEAALRKTGE